MPIFRPSHQARPCIQACTAPPFSMYRYLYLVLKPIRPGFKNVVLFLGALSGPLHLVLDAARGSRCIVGLKLELPFFDHQIFLFPSAHPMTGTERSHLITPSPRLLSSSWTIRRISARNSDDGRDHVTSPFAASAEELASQLAWYVGIGFAQLPSWAGSRRASFAIPFHGSHCSLLPPI